MTSTASKRIPRRNLGRPGALPKRTTRDKAPLAKIDRRTAGHRNPAPIPKRDSGWDDLSEPIRDYIEGGDGGAATSVATNEATLVEEFASKIKASTVRSVQEILKRGDYCVQAKKRLTAKGYGALLKKLPFGASDFSKYVRIGNDQRLRTNIKHLPPSFSTIYLVSGLSNKQLNVGIEAGIISAKATREDIERFRDKAATSKPTATPAGKSRPGAPAKAPDKQTRTGRKVADEDDFFDLPEEDEDEASEKAKEADTIYKGLVAAWKANGLRRSAWLATPPAVRDKFWKDVLQPEPFKPTPTDE